MLWIEAVSKYKATHLQAPNFAFKLTARKFSTASTSKSNLDLSSVRHIINAAEPVDEESMERVYPPLFVCLQALSHNFYDDVMENIDIHI